MIKNKQIELKIVPANINYWKNKKYDVQLGDIISAPICDVPSKSSVMVDCVCDICHRLYTQRFYRDTAICGYCKSSSRMKGNKLGSGNIKHIIPDNLKDVLLQNAGIGKKALSDMYGVNIITVNRWLSELRLSIPPYQGRKYYKDDHQKSADMTKLDKYTGAGLHISEISRLTGIPKHIITTIRPDLHISKFDIWKKNYENILDNIMFYASENAKKTLKEIADEHSISIEQLKKAFDEKGIQVKLHSWNKSKGEIECKEYIRSLGEQCHSYLFGKKFEIDCFVKNKNFGLEYCGEYWHRYEKIKNNKYQHYNKYKSMKDNGLKLFTLFESEWKTKKPIVKSMISSRLGYAKKIYARKCNLIEINSSTGGKFHDLNHISGKTVSTYNIALEYKGEIISVLSFIKSRFDKTFQYEISRYSTLLHHQVVGGFSKMFRYFTERYNIQSCMTYADLRFGEGQVYSKNGFTYAGTTVPNYHYYNRTLGIMESRMKYQKSKLKKLFPVLYSDKKTEFQIMQEAGYFILYDCGSNKYIWKRGS